MGGGKTGFARVSSHRESDPNNERRISLNKKTIKTTVYKDLGSTSYAGGLKKGDANGGANPRTDEYLLGSGPTQLKE